jgi:hypothetical protein
MLTAPTRCWPATPGSGDGPDENARSPTATSTRNCAEVRVLMVGQSPGHPERLYACPETTRCQPDRCQPDQERPGERRSPEQPRTTATAFRGNRTPTCHPNQHFRSHMPPWSSSAIIYPYGYRVRSVNANSLGGLPLTKRDIRPIAGTEQRDLLAILGDFDDARVFAIHGSESRRTPYGQTDW